MHPGSVCAVVSAQNTRSSIGNVMRQLYRAGIRECVVVVNGSEDGTRVVASEWLERLFDGGNIVEIPDSLGYDVPRALGTYCALREKTSAQHFVYADGDWQGSFGPMLEAFLTGCTLSDVALCTFPTATANRENLVERPDRWLWHSVLAQTHPELTEAAPSHLPLLVSRRVFAQISPYWLHHPGRFFALCLLSCAPILRVSGFAGWDTRVLGNPVRNDAHQQRMLDTMIGDTLEGCCLLMQKRPQRTWRGRTYDGYHSTRRLDVLDQWQSSVILENQFLV